MKSTNLRLTVKLFFALFCIAWLGPTATAQPQTLAWKPGDSVEVEWKGKWFKAKVVEAKDDSYKVHYDGYDARFDESVGTARIRALKDSAEIGKAVKNEKPAFEWTWTDAAGNTKTKSDFQDILRQHSQWLGSSGLEGTRADLSGANLGSADLTGVKLDRAEMPGVKLTKANLMVASLNDANLVGAAVTESDLTGTSLNGANLSDAQFYKTTVFAVIENINLSGAFFSQSKIEGTWSGANFSGAKIISSDLSSINLSGADLSQTVIFDSNFTNALLGSANLSKAWVRGGDWTDANLLAADVRDLRFEPAKNPDIRTTAGASNLEFITYGTSPDAVTLLRNNLREAGFDEAQSKLTYALKRRHNQLYKEQGPGNWIKYVYYYLNLIFFDWTVHYGLRPERALIIMIYLWLVFAVIYDLFIHFPGRSGIFLVKNRVRKNAELTSAMRIRPRVITPTSQWKYLWRWFLSEWRVLRISLFFSATRALHLGYGDLDLGRWLQMLTKREYEIKPKHWSRSFAGLQSLISLYLIVMWLLTEFGNPFD